MNSEPVIELFPIPPPPPRRSRTRDPFNRTAAERPYSQPRRPNWSGTPITKLERRIINSGKFQYEVAAEANVNPSLLSNIVHGRKNPSPTVLIKLARYFNCDPRELMGYES